MWSHPHLLVLDEITTHLDFYTVVALSKALRTFNGALLLVSHDRFLVKTVIEGNIPLFSEHEDEASDEDEEQMKLERSLYVLRNGRLNLLNNGVRQFEESLEKKTSKVIPLGRSMPG